MMVLACVMQLLVGVVWLRVVMPDASLRMGRWLMWSLAAVLGIALTGMANWLLLWVWPTRSAAMLAGTETGMFVVGWAAAALRATGDIRGAFYERKYRNKPTPPPFVPRFCFAIATLLLMFALAQATWQLSATLPHGHWDAWMTWNLRARFLASNGQWRDFYSTAMAGQRQDYPMLLPITVARLWTWTDAINTTAPRVVCVIAATLTLSVLMATLHRLRGMAHAIIGGIVLLSSGFFITHATSQYADTLQGLALLAAMTSLLLLHADEGAPPRMWVLLGLMTGIVLNVKNEGTAQAVGIALGVALLLWRASAVSRSGAMRRCGVLALGLSLPMIWLVHGKMQAVVGNDMLSNASSAGLTQLLTDIDRHAMILRAWRRLFPLAIDLPALGLLIATVAAGLVVPVGRGNRWGAAAIVGSAVAVGLGGAYMAYLLGAADLPSWLAQGSDRVFIQLWPSIVLTCVLALPTLMETRQWLAPPSTYDGVAS
jgi:hypothetical protein